MPLPSKLYLEEQKTNPVQDKARQLAENLFPSSGPLGQPDYTEAPKEMVSVPTVNRAQALVQGSGMARGVPARSPQERYPQLKKAMEAVSKTKPVKEGAPPTVAEVVGFQPAETPDYQTANQVPEVPDTGVPTDQRNDPRSLRPNYAPPVGYTGSRLKGEFDHEARRAIDKATYDANLAESKKKYTDSKGQ